MKNNIMHKIFAVTVINLLLIIFFTGCNNKEEISNVNKDVHSEEESNNGG